MTDNHESGKRPPVPPAKAVPQIAREAAEAKILREGEFARENLARRLAAVALSDPGQLTPKRLARLGSEGLSRFIVELRRGAIGEDPPPLVKPSRPAKASSPGSKAQSPEPGPPGAGTPPRPPGVAAMTGWWQSTYEGEPLFETTARLWGYSVGAMCLLLCLALVAANRV